MAGGATPRRKEKKGNCHHGHGHGEGEGEEGCSGSGGGNGSPPGGHDRKAPGSKRRKSRKNAYEEIPKVRRDGR